MDLKSKVQPLIWQENKLLVLDQRLLPYEKKYISIKSYKEIINSIKDMIVRGAPLIGITAAYGMALAAFEFENQKTGDKKSLVAELKTVGEEIKNARSTAVNLKWAVDLILNDITNVETAVSLSETVLKRAQWIHEDDAIRCQKIGENGAEFILNAIMKNDQDYHACTDAQPGRLSRSARNDISILTICNTGALATGGIGTAFGVILTLFQKELNLKVYASETRPRQQGARLTTFECSENGIDCTLITDTACGYLMKKGEVDLVIAGADRIAANGDTANKIGTYQLAVLAKEHNIPFYIAAPLSTFDLSCKSGNDIPIEEREEEEVKNINGKSICVENTKIWNPAFDITPGEYITGIITEKGIISKDHKDKIKIFFESATVA